MNVLAAEGLKVPKKTVWTTIKNPHDTIHCLPGSGRCFQLEPERLAIIEERIQEDDETTASQLVRILNAQGYTISKPTIVRARNILGWTFHGSRYCQMIRNNNKEKRV